MVGPYARHYGGGAISSSTLWNPEYIHMLVPGMGSQPYVVGRAYWRTIVIGIGDPLAHPAHWSEMAAAFKRAFPHATYAHTGPEFSRLLRDEQGYAVNDMGAETNILIQKWAYSKKTRTIRNAARDARGAGVEVRELSHKDLTTEVCRQLANVTGAINSSWGCLLLFFLGRGGGFLEGVGAHVGWEGGRERGDPISGSELSASPAFA
jgi:hypothetical protein